MRRINTGDEMETLHPMTIAFHVPSQKLEQNKRVAELQTCNDKKGNDKCL